jgi:hypothetical protein
LGLLLAAPAATACTATEAAKAEMHVASQKTWSGLSQAYDRYEHCDDGAVAEGYSNAVGGMLSQRWGEIVKLGSLVEKHPSFRSFVLGHLDETVHHEVLDTIKHNAEHACPQGLFVLCAEISATVAEIPSSAR